MPCSDGGVPYGPTPEEVANAKFGRRAPSLLCSACRALEQFGFDFDTNPELSEWWDKHKKEDAERERKENARRLELEAVSEILRKQFNKLTDEDKRLLKKHKYM
jgi:hypothetical protein